MTKVVARLAAPMAAARETLDLFEGITVEVKPYTTLIYQTARARAVRKVTELREAQAREIEALGAEAVDFGDLGDLRDQDRFQALFQMLLLQELAVEAITAWDGLGDPSGDGAAPLTPENVRTMIRLFPTLAQRFQDLYQGERWEIETEGEGSGTSADTTSQEAKVPTTAEAAKKRTAKPAKTAPTKPASRKRASGRSRGKSSRKATATS